MNQTKQEQRQAFLERYKKPGCPSIKTIAEEMGLSKATLYSWITADKQKQRGLSMTKRKGRFSPLNKFKIIAEAEGLSGAQLQEFCDQKGISISELSSWRDLALSSMDMASEGVVSQSTHNSEVKKLKAQLERKDKALAEAAALLLLQKKTSDILGGEK